MSAFDPDEVTPVIVRNPSNRRLVSALSNHALVLDSVRQGIEAIRDRVAAADSTPPRDELEALGREFRREADSAHDLAREVEALARKPG